MKTVVIQFCMLLICITLSAQGTLTNKGGLSIFTRFGLRNINESILGLEYFTSNGESFEISGGPVYAARTGERLGCFAFNRPNRSYKEYKLSIGYTADIHRNKYLNINFFFSKRRGEFSTNPDACFSEPTFHYNETQREYGAMVYFVRNKKKTNQVKSYFGFGVASRQTYRVDQFNRVTKPEILNLQIDLGVKLYALRLKDRYFNKKVKKKDK